MLAHCVGPTLDVGCGPGRMSAHLAGRGRCVLGIDVVREAVDQTRARGVSALLRDVFAPLPGEGRWDTALLADGNIGIGGDPVALLRRVAHAARAGRPRGGRPGAVRARHPYATVRLAPSASAAGRSPGRWSAPTRSGAVAAAAAFAVLGT